MLVFKVGSVCFIPRLLLFYTNSLVKLLSLYKGPFRVIYTKDIKYTNKAPIRLQNLMRFLNE